MVLPEAVALKRTTPLLCWNVPANVSQLPPTVVVAVGKVTVPFVMVKLLLAVTVFDVNDQLPLTPLKVRLLKLDEPGVIVLPVVVAMKFTVPVRAVKVPLLSQ